MSNRKEKTGKGLKNKILRTSVRCKTYLLTPYNDYNLVLFHSFRWMS